jgi:hypothetical protein
MANGNLRIVSTNDMRQDQLKARSSQQAVYIADSPVDPPPEEALRLMRAFTRISDRRQRARLIEQAEKIANP